MGWMFNALMLIFLGGIMVLFLYISILSNNEKMLIPARVRSIGLIFFLVLFTFNTQDFFNRSTYSSGTRSEAGTDTSLIYHGLMSPHILVLIVLKIRITPHLVTVLLRLEVLSLSTLFSGICLTFGSRLMSSFVLAFFTIIVCEACIGLGVLVISSRSQGSDKILSMY